MLTETQSIPEEIKAGIHLRIREVNGIEKELLGFADQYQVEMFEKAIDCRNEIEIDEQKLSPEPDPAKLEYEIEISIFPPIR